MIDWKLVIGILSSSVLAALLTKSLDFYANRIAFKRDYYKKIIDKRIEAYDMGMQFVHDYIAYFDFNNPYSAAFTNDDQFELFKSRLQELGPYRIWHTKSVNRIISSIIKIAMDSHNYFATLDLVTDKHIKDRGREIYTPLRDQLINMQRELVFNLININDVEDFLKNKYKDLPQNL